MGSNRTIKFSKGTWHHITIRESKGPSRGITPKCETHERNPCAPRLEERTQDETLHQERCARRLSTGSKFGVNAPTSKSPEERELVVEFGASMHMLSKKDLSSDELESLRRSRNPTTVVTANGEVQTDEEAQENVNDLDLFLTVQILGDTPAVLSLGKLCEEHGYTYEWASGRTTSYPLLSLDCRQILVPARLLHRHRRTHQVHLQVQQQSEVTIGAPGTWRGTPKTQKQK